MGDFNWSDEQWRKVNAAVTETFGKANVASSFLPLYGPLPGGAETVRNEILDSKAPPPILRLDSDHSDVNERLLNLTVRVELSSEQVADESLSNALLAFRRAATILAKEEDRIVFSEFDSAAKGNVNAYVANGKKTVKGLSKFGRTTPSSPFGGKPLGPDLLAQIVEAIQMLDENANPGPFACVLGNDLFSAAYEANLTLVLPADRILPLLNGPLLRSSGLAANEGILVSLSTGAVDIVVGTPPTVQFLQRTPEARFLFRVYTRFALRVRDAGAIVRFHS